MALLAACALAAVAGQSARVWPRADVCNYFLPVWLALGLSGLVLALAWPPGRRWPTIVLAGLLVGCAADRVLPEFTAWRALRTARPPADLRLIQFNLAKDNVDPAATAAWITAQHADVAVLEEAAASAAPIPGMLSKTMPYRATCFRKGHCSTMILSRTPFLAAAPLGCGDPENRRGRSLLAVALAGPGGAFTIVGVHMEHPWPRDRQGADLIALDALRKALPADSTLVAGDFNMVPWAIRMARQDRMIGLSRLTRGLATWPARWMGHGTVVPILAIDHVYAGSNWRLVRIGRGIRLGSDHLPVVVDLKWTGPRRQTVRSGFAETAEHDGRRALPCDRMRRAYAGGIGGASRTAGKGSSPRP